LKLNVDELKNDKLKLCDEVHQLQMKLKSVQTMAQNDLEAFKSEIRAKEECIQKMRQEIMCVQEKRDANLSEVVNLDFFYSECFLFDF
jgi:hypothetical protein